MGIDINSGYGYAGSYAGNSEASSSISLSSRKQKSRSLLATASAAMLSVALASAANAQSLPAGCDPSTALTGGDITCVVAAPGTIDPIETTVDDLTITIGDDTTPTAVETPAVSPPDYAIDMNGAASQTLNIVNSGSSVTGGNGAVNVEVTGGVGDLTIVTEAGASVIAERTDAIRALNQGSGSIDIQSGGSARATNVSSASAVGIRATNYGAGSLSVTANEVLGHSAIIAENNNGGALSVTTGDSRVYGDQNSAIIARNDAYGAALTIQTGAGRVGAYQFGIQAVQGGADDLRITTGTGLVYGGIAIKAEHEAAGDTWITANGDVRGKTDSGILVSNEAIGGAITVTAYSKVEGDGLSGGDGIRASNYGTGDLTITTGAGLVKGTTTAIRGRHSGTGAIKITTGTGRLLGEGDDGISAQQTGTGDVDITIRGIVDAGNSAGYGSGVDATTTSGAIGITMLSSEAVTSTSGIGIFAEAKGGATAGITVQGASGSVTGYTDGMILSTDGGAIMVGNLGSVTGSTGNGIDANSAGGDITITNVANILGGGDVGSTGHGIVIDSVGGDISIQAVGVGDGNLVEGRNGSGIYVDTNTLGVASINIGGVAAVGNIKGSSYGIYATNSGIGSIVINSSAGTVEGGDYGIKASHSGTGSVSVTTAAVTSTITDAISVYGGVNVVDLSVNTVAGEVTGARRGVSVSNAGTGAVSIITADVTGQGSYGVYAYSEATNLTIDTSAGTVKGGSSGIYASHAGSGNVGITVNDVTGYSAEGIRAVATQASSSITVQGSSGDINGATDGIYMRTAGGDIVVDNLDSVTGNAGDGIEAKSNGGAIAITAVDTILGTGGNGIIANAGTGDISIQGVGLVDGVEGTLGSGIVATGSGNIDIGGTAAIGDVTGYDRAVSATISSGAGNITIDTSAGYAYGYDQGIVAENQGTGDISIATAGVYGGK
ncbi:hypothetical protein, partial [Parasphingorhabdus sp.]